MKNFKARAKTLRRKMSECAFDQSSDGPSAENLLETALENAFNEGKQSVYDMIEDLLKAVERQKTNENKENEINDHTTSGL
jgi:hypothetical protein